MPLKNVSFTSANGLCTSCGICKNMCPKSCISWDRKNGMYYPKVNSDTCVNCGLCIKVCPGLSGEYPNQTEPLKAVYGDAKQVFNAWSKDEVKRHVSASGGVVSTIIQTLLNNDIFDVAFMVDSYSYSHQLISRPYTAAVLQEDWNISKTPKSRYLSVSHELAVQYIKENPDKKIILTGTSCAIRGINNVIEVLHRDRSNYLLIGLFCDKVFNYNVYQYFEKNFGNGRNLSALQFKNKESGGWPGNMKLFFDDGTYAYLDKEERGKVKEAFMPERCLYCIDKLNVKADISLGDNYTKQNSSSLGSNSVIIRTTQGEYAWNLVSDFLEYELLQIEKLRWAQYLDGRLNNLYYAKLKEHEIEKNTGVLLELNSGVNTPENALNYECAWRHSLALLHAGEIFEENPNELQKQFVLIEKRRSKRNLSAFAERVYYAIKRRILPRI